MEPPENFDFPFPPYQIQHEFMKKLYEVIENKKLGIFESPTGTGKSLSIICGVLRWLHDHNQEERNSFESQIKALEEKKLAVSSNSNDWLQSQAEEIEINRKLIELRLEQNKVLEYDRKIEKLQTKKKLNKPKKFLSNPNKNDQNDIEDDHENVEEEELLLDDVAPPLEDNSDEEEENKHKPVKILICSRTHSQLSQLVKEIIKSPYGKDSRVVSLASRQNYCINHAVSKLKSLSLINERCLDMQNKSKKSTKVDEDGKTIKRQKGSCQCPYSKKQNIEELRDASLVEILDVEDLVTTAKELKGCPYYASRKAVEDAQIVLLPYNTLMHKSTREASGITLKNNVVIVDEAHNLVEALAQMYSCEITYGQLEEAHAQLSGYKQRFSTRFAALNLLSIKQLIFIVDKLMKLLSKECDGPDEVKSDIHTIQNFVLTAEIDNYNMFKLIQFCRNSRIAQKIHSYTSKYPIDAEDQKKTKKLGVKGFLSSIENKKKGVSEATPVADPKKPAKASTSSFLALASFLEALTYSCEDGRIIVYRTKEKKQNKLRFLLLNPAAQFREIVQEARSVIVAGGTMKPVEEFERLFVNAGASSDRIVGFSCDHIIPPQNILPIAVTKGCNGENLLFNYENRSSLGNSVKLILQEICAKVPGGVVVFFPSYKYEALVWQQLKDVKIKKPIFREPQDSGSVDSVLNSYAAAINKPNSEGALMLSVVGGKLSEGLNFSDDLGRCVIVIGLPYANIKSPELKQKMEYLDSTEGRGAGNKFYEAICMKAVNQCIGRAIRHKNDYACVLLLDVRYEREMAKNSLPGWIKRSLITRNFKDSVNEIDKFFKERKMH